MTSVLETTSEQVYLNLLRKTLECGHRKEGRNGNTVSLFSEQMRFPLREGFPLLTTKAVPFKLVLTELLWFIEAGRGTGYRLSDHRLKEMSGRDSTIWTANESADYWKPKQKFPGDLGRIYGAQWRNWGAEGIDQLQVVIDTLRSDPNSRRMFVSAWNPSELEDMALPPCHTSFNLWHDGQGNISLHMLQRSCDMFLGVPFNIASYALLLEMLATVTGMKAGELVITLGDAHIYEEHVPQVEEQISRQPRALPKLHVTHREEIDDFTVDDFVLEGYDPHPKLTAEMKV